MNALFSALRQRADWQTPGARFGRLFEAGLKSAAENRARTSENVQSVTAAYTTNRSSNAITSE